MREPRTPGDYAALESISESHRAVDYDDRPDLSDFADEMREADYLGWCQEQGLDPEETETAIAYEQDYDQFSH